MWKLFILTLRVGAIVKKINNEKRGVFMYEILKTLEKSNISILMLYKLFY